MGNKMHVRKNDKVQIISGKDKGKTGNIIQSFPADGKVKVEGVNILTKHQKPTQAMQQGGIIREEGKIDASNVLLYCDSCGRGVRAGKKVKEDGTKVRVCRKCGQELDD